MKNYFCWCISTKITFLMVPWWWSFSCWYLQWMPPSLDQVHEEAVEQYFSKIDDPQWEELNLPSRHSHGRNIESKLWLKSWANELNRASMVAETTHHFKFGESLQTTDEIKVNMPYRSPFITVETLCCLFVKLCPFYNNYSWLVAAMISFVLVTAHDLCIVILVWSFYLQSSVQTHYH